MKVDVFTTSIETARYIANVAHASFDPKRDRDDTDEPVMYHILGIKYTYLKNLEDKLDYCDIRNAKKGEPIKINK